MKLIKTLLFIVFFGLLGTLKAQDIHFSLFNMSPLTLNPALTGAFSGTARIGGIYRDQWASILDNQFVTPSFYVDAPIIRGFRKNDWLGVGGMIYNDKAGTSKLRTNVSMLSVAYHLALGKDGKTILTLGLQGGSVQRRIDIMSDKLIFADELPENIGGGGLGIGSGADRDAREKLNYLDFNGGLMLRSVLNDNNLLELGVSFGHVTTPEYGFLTSGGSGSAGDRPFRTTAHGRLEFGLTDQWSITPTFLFQSTSGATEVAFQGWAGYQINKDFRLNFGAGYRFDDAAKALAGLDYQDLRVALAYDVNVSSLTELSNYKGGFEIAAYYIIKIFKSPDVKPAILCPKF